MPAAGVKHDVEMNEDNGNAVHERTSNSGSAKSIGDHYIVACCQLAPGPPTRTADHGDIIGVRLPRRLVRCLGDHSRWMAGAAAESCQVARVIFSAAD